MSDEDTDETETPSDGEWDSEPIPVSKPAYPSLELDEHTGSDRSEHGWSAPDHE